LKSGVTIYFATYAVPGGKWASRYGEGGISGGVEAIHRDMKDPASGLHFGYELAFTGDAVNGYQAVFRPLSGAGPGPKLPPPQAVRDGDTIAFDIMVSPDGTQRIMDYVQVFLRAPEPAAASSHAEARDFTVDDGAITYDTSAMTFWIDGRKQTGVTGFTGKAGSTFWVAFPGRGRYVLSLVPHEGFSMAGVVRDNAAAFQDGPHAYEVRFMGAIAGRGKAWNLYVRHDWAGPQADAIRSGTGRVEELVGR
jgi:hypothetical protein